MYAIVAENHDAYEKFLRDNFVYVGDERDIQRINPKRVNRILFVGNYDKHPIYFSDSFLKFQIEVAACKSKRPKKVWWRFWD